MLYFCIIWCTITPRYDISITIKHFFKIFSLHEKVRVFSHYVFPICLLSSIDYNSTVVHCYYFYQQHRVLAHDITCPSLHYAIITIMSAIISNIPSWKIQFTFPAKCTANGNFVWKRCDKWLIIDFLFCFEWQIWR